MRIVANSVISVISAIPEPLSTRRYMVGEEGWKLP